jgi:hypothetical protein
VNEYFSKFEQKKEDIVPITYVKSQNKRTLKFGNNYRRRRDCWKKSKKVNKRFILDISLNERVKRAIKDEIFPKSLNIKCVNDFFIVAGELLLKEYE